MPLLLSKLNSKFHDTNLKSEFGVKQSHIVLKTEHLYMNTRRSNERALSTFSSRVLQTLPQNDNKRVSLVFQVSTSYFVRHNNL